MPIGALTAKKEKHPPRGHLGNPFRRGMMERWVGYSQGHVAGEEEGYHLWCRRCRHDMRNTKEVSGKTWLREAVWTGVKRGCFLGGGVVAVYYISWPLFKWLVRMALQ
mgnify:CR=1 FL=1